MTHPGVSGPMSPLTLRAGVASSGSLAGSVAHAGMIHGNGPPGLPTRSIAIRFIGGSRRVPVEKRHGSRKR